jgi:gliding motility-associated-like protein
MRIKSLIIFFIISFSSNAQLVVDTATYTVEDLVYSHLIGNGIWGVSNISYNQGSATLSPPNVGYFNGVNSNIGLSEGVIMATGNATIAIGPNDLGSASSTTTGAGIEDDLAILSQTMSLFDIASIEFEFMTLGDTLFINYVFASEEYPEYSGGSFNDVFGIFISGPGISGPYSNNAINLAKVPGTNSDISINTINNGSTNSGPCVNCSYYVNNGNGGAPQNGMPDVVQYDGFTVEIESSVKVVCGEVYKIKFAIADVMDATWDSGLFIKKGSLRSNEAIWSLGSPTVQNNTITVCEGETPPLILVTSSSYEGSAVTWWFDDDLTQFYQNGDTIPVPYFTGNYTLYGVPKLGSCFGDVVMVEIEGISSSSIETSLDQTFCPGDTVLLEISGAQSYLWSFHPSINGGLTDSVINVIPMATTNYHVQAFLGNCIFNRTINLLQDAGCAIGGGNLLMVNAFTPNGDGVNDTWIVPQITDLDNTVRIFSRWGDMLIQLDRYDNFNVVWDGKNSKGEGLPAGTYFYTIEMYTDAKTYSGWVQINRD